MAVNKNFVVKQGLEVKENLLVAEGTTSKVGIGTTAPLYTTHVIGGIGATDLYVSGVSTFSGAIDANGAIDVDGHTELDDVNVSGASTFTGIGYVAGGNGNGGNGASGGDGGYYGNTGGGGGSGYQDGSVTVIDTMQGGSTGDAKVVLRVIT